MDTIKFNNKVLLQKHSDNLSSYLEVIFPEEMYYELLEQRFNVRIEDADGIDESVLTRVLRQYDGRFVAVTWDDEPTDDTVQEVAEFIFGDRTLVYVAVTLVETLQCTDMRGTIREFDQELDSVQEEYIFVNKGYRDRSTLIQSLEDIKCISTRLSNELYNATLGA